MARRRSGSLLVRLAPLGSLGGLGMLAVAGEHYALAGLLGAGAAVAGYRLLDREGNARRELWRRARSNVRALERVAREDPVSAPQMRRIAELQGGLLESWELLPEQYRPLLDEDVFSVVEEVENAVRLARRRAALRRHLDGMERQDIRRRIRSLQEDLAQLEEGSPLRATFERALAGRRAELAGYEEMLDGVSMINAQLESAESLLGSLRGDLLTLEAGLAPQALEGGLDRLKERVALFKRSMDEVTRAVGKLHEPATEELPAR